jgi:hypothetical protein
MERRSGRHITELWWQCELGVEGGETKMEALPEKKEQH